MLKNYIKIAWRSLWRQKEYTVLNIAGLAIGLTCFITILIFVKQEYSYDTFHTKADRIYRVVQHVSEDERYANTGGAMPVMLEKEFSDIESIVSFTRFATHVSIDSEDGQRKTFREEKFLCADTGFFEMFNFPLIKGSTQGTLSDPFKVLVTEEMAEKYFGTANPIGKELILTGNFRFTVVGVLKNVPSNSHIQFDFVTGMSSFKATENIPVTARFGSFWWPNVWTYVLLNTPESAGAINAQLPQLIKQYRDKDGGQKYIPQLQPLSDVYLSEGYNQEMEPGGSRSTLYLFMSVGFLTLLLAGINFINLTTAKAAKRTKEIGVRRTVGAQRKQLVQQFFLEALLVNIVALLVACCLAELSLPLFASITGRSIPFAISDLLGLWPYLLAVLLISTLLSGFYPALYLSGIKPVWILKGTAFKPGGRDLRKSLVIAQFSLSIVLVFSAAIIYLQTSYMIEANLGFQKEHIISLKGGEEVKKNFDILKTQLRQLSSVQEVTASDALPGIGSGYMPQFDFPGKDPQERPGFYQQSIDHNYFETLQIPLLAGRGFLPGPTDEGTSTLMRERFPAYAGRNFIINESAARAMGKTPEEVIGMPFRSFTEEQGLLFSDTKGVVIGVVKDYHTFDLRYPIVPTVFVPVKSAIENNASYLILKLNRGSFASSLEEIKGVWKSVVADTPLHYSFLDEQLEQQYAKEAQLKNMMGVFALLTMVVSSLGLFGLSAFTAESRQKEISIRKILGASVSNITLLLSKDFAKLVAIALLLAIPLAWYFMQHWLQDFAHRITVEWWMFALTGLVALTIAMLTVSFQSIKSALVNPVKNLRSE